MKTRKRKTMAEIKTAVLQNNLMKRFLLEIGREEQLDDYTLKSIPVYKAHYN
jgi:hypothetical protein